MDDAAPKSRVVRRESIPPPTGNGSSPDARSLDEFVQNLRDTVAATVDEDIKFYKRTVKWPRLAAQLVTSLTIIVAAVLPFLAAAEYPNKAVVVGAASVTVAVLTGLAAYWRWTDEWRGYVIALVTLNYLRAGWELELAEASLLPPDRAREASVRATIKLVRQAGASVRRETSVHFDSLVQAMDTKGGQES
jgi:hypothetical protein